jgi:outer membrane protein assembly factor BamB
VSTDPSISSKNAAMLGVSWMVNTGATALGSPVVAWNAKDQTTLVYVSNEAGYFTAIDVATHQPRWSINFGGGLRSTPLVEGKYVWVVPSTVRRIYKLNAGTGAVQCSAPLPFEADASPTIATPPGGSPTIYTGVNDKGSSNGPLVAIDEGTCRVDFSATPEPAAGTGGIWDPISYAVDANGEGLVLFGTADPDAAVYAVDAITGNLVWRYQTQNPAPGIFDVGAGVTISPPGRNGFADGVAYVVNKDGYLDALDLTTGALIWSVHHQGTISTPALVGSDLIYGNGNRLASINATTGALVWQTAASATIDGSPTVVGPPGARVAAYGDMNGIIHVVSVATGSQLYRFQTGNFIVTALAEYDGNLVAASGDGYLYDFAVGGGDGTAPTTRVTAPVDGSTVPNPAGSLVVSGSASTSSGNSISAVSVAIQAGGAGGVWWDSATGTWIAAPYGNAATLTAAGSSATTWSLSFPVPPAGASYGVFASAVRSNGVADISAEQSQATPARSSFAVSPSNTAPTLTTPTQWVAPASQVSFTGRGFQPAEQVAVMLAQTQVATVTADSTGRLGTTRFNVPAPFQFGLTSLTATGQSSGLSTTTPMYVTNSWSEFGSTPDRLSSEPNDVVLFNHLAVGPTTFLTQAWTFNSSAPIHTSPAVVRGQAFFANDAGVIYDVDVATGMQRWVHVVAAQSAIDSSPAIDPTTRGGLVITATHSGHVVALSMVDGTVRWSASLGSSAIESSPAVSGGVVYVGSDAGVLYALNEANGAILWNATLAGPIHSSPAVDGPGGTIVIGDDSGAVTALSTTTGAQLWSVGTGGPVVATPVVGRGAVYVGSEDGNMYALSESSGASVWKTDLGSAITASAALLNSTLLVGDQSGAIMYLSPASGAQTYVQNFGSAVVGVGMAQGFTVGETTNGQVTGSKGPGRGGWSVTLPLGLASSPTVINGEVFVTGLDGMLHCFTIPGNPPV